MSYGFVITPPFWRTPWFYLISVASGLLGVYGLVRIRERKLRQRQLLLEEKVEARTRALQRQQDQVVRINEKLQRINWELEQLSLVARETDNAVFIADGQGRIEWVNEGFTRMTGYTLETLIRDKGETLQAISNNPGITQALGAVWRESGDSASRMAGLDPDRMRDLFAYAARVRDARE